MEMEKVKKELMHMFHAWRILLGSLVKWILLSIVIGGVIGVIASAFANLITWATDFRMGHMWMVYLLPFAGLMIVFLYHVTGQEKNAGTDMVLMVVRSDQNTMPGRVAPLILIATALTHLFGGSAGREGAALQFGASLGNWLGRKIHLNESDKRIMTAGGYERSFCSTIWNADGSSSVPDGGYQRRDYVLCSARSVRVLRIYRRADFYLYGCADADSTVSRRRSSEFLWNRVGKSDSSGNLFCICRSAVLRDVTYF